MRSGRTQYPRFGRLIGAPLAVIGTPSRRTIAAEMTPVSWAGGTLSGSTQGCGTMKIRKPMGKANRRNAAVPKRNHTNPAMTRIIATDAAK